MKLWMGPVIRVDEFTYDALIRACRDFDGPAADLFALTKESGGEVLVIKAGIGITKEPAPGEELTQGMDTSIDYAPHVPLP